jgi:predicted nucleic acid-binding protein
MIVVVSDASPINILIRIGHVDLLPSLFGQVYVPPSVVEELTADGTPPAVRDWVHANPSWLVVKTPENAAPRSQSRHRGEFDAIELALEIGADALLIDEVRGRRLAAQRGLLTLGTVGLLERAADQGLIDDLSASHDRLREMGFHVAEGLLANSLAAHRARKSSRG